MQHPKVMKKILLVFGTRPEAIKMVPLILEFKRYPSLFDVKVCITGQHREMLDNVLHFFQIVPDFDLNLMAPNQQLEEVFVKIISKCTEVYKVFNPDYVAVHGDTITCLGASLAAFLQKIKVLHIEAGLRTYQHYSPFPEEISRQMVSRIATYHFAPTKTAERNLIEEKVCLDNICVTGNTVIDALLNSVQIVSSLEYKDKEIENLKSIINKQKVVLVTGHRRENFGEGFKNICIALREIAYKNQDIQIIYPVHLNPNVKDIVYEYLNSIPNVILIPPLNYPAFVWLMHQSYFIITDSGGVQEEAPSLGKPVLVMRDNTERPEAIEAGTVILVGTDVSKIIGFSEKLIHDDNFYNSFAKINNPYGDGEASRRIIEFLNFKISGEKEFV